MSRIEKLREVLKNHQAQKIDGFLMDVTTADLLLRCHSMASDRTKEFIETKPLDKVVDIAWRGAGNYE